MSAGSRRRTVSGARAGHLSGSRRRTVSGARAGHLFLLKALNEFMQVLRVFVSPTRFVPPVLLLARWPRVAGRGSPEGRPLRIAQTELSSDWAVRCADRAHLHALIYFVGERAWVELAAKFLCSDGKFLWDSN